MYAQAFLVFTVAFYLLLSFVHASDQKVEISSKHKIYLYKMYLFKSNNHLTLNFYDK